MRGFCSPWSGETGASFVGEDSRRSGTGIQRSPQINVQIERCRHHAISSDRSGFPSAASLALLLELG